eukprot:scaffold3359_cov123-Cylindrotheca_fusiformis.AAC.22
MGRDRWDVTACFKMVACSNVFGSNYLVEQELFAVPRIVRTQQGYYLRFKNKALADYLGKKTVFFGMKHTGHRFQCASIKMNSIHCFQVLAVFEDWLVLLRSVYTVQIEGYCKD